MGKINLTDSMFDVAFKMSEGNPGALSAIRDILQNGKTIGPDAGELAGIAPLLDLDEMGVYGSSIYVLWSDICNRDTVKMLAVMRGVQLGMLSRAALQDAVSRQDRSGASLIPVDDLLKQVKERLPNFGN